MRSRQGSGEQRRAVQTFMVRKGSSVRVRLRASARGADSYRVALSRQLSRSAPVLASRPARRRFDDEKTHAVDGTLRRSAGPSGPGGPCCPLSPCPRYRSVARCRGPHISAEDLKSYAAQQLTSYKRPTELIVLDALPAASTGKILKHKLREIAIDRAGANPPAAVAAGFLSIR